jgi:hypothetical protein
MKGEKTKSANIVVEEEEVAGHSSNIPPAVNLAIE